MNWGALEIQVLSFCGSTITFATNWLLQSTLLIGLGLLAARICRSRGSAIQSVVYRTTLVAVLFGPIVSLAMSYQGLDGWSVRLPPTFSYSEARPKNLVSELSVPFDGLEKYQLRDSGVASFPSNRHSGQIADDLSVYGTGIGDTERQSDRAFAGDIGAVATPMPEAAIVDGAGNSTTTPVTKAGEMEILDVFGFGLFAAGLVVVWITIGSLLACRLAFVMWQMHRLRRRSILADEQDVATCRRIAKQMNVAGPNVLRSPFLTSPILHGVFHPAIMLPEETAQPLEDIFVHELAHLQRRDCFWLLLSRITTAVFFFQPLLWWLGRRIASSAEEVCDDYVVQFGGNRESYARSLIDIASLSVTPMAATGVRMVSQRSMLEQRVTRIMDTSRLLSTRVGNLLLLVIAGGLTSTMIAGFVGLSPKSSWVLAASPPDESQAESADGIKEEVDTNVSTRRQSDKTESSDASQLLAKAKPPGEPDSDIKGVVTGKNGRAVAGAKLFWFRTRVHDVSPMMPKLVATTGQDGRFSFTRPALPDRDIEPASWDFHERILVVAPGHGFERTWPEGIRRDGGVKLPPAGKPLRGRIVNIDGEPVTGAAVRIRHYTELGDLDAGDLTEKRTRNSDAAEWRVRLGNLLNVIEPVSQRFALPTTITNSNGEFELKDVGANRLFQLLLTGEGIQSTDIIVRNTGGESISVASERHSTNKPTTVHGNNFLFVALPSQSVTGRVVDLDSGQPIENAVVRAFMVHGERVSSSRERQHFATRTDKNGLYRITGLPLGKDNELVAFTTDDVAYIPVGQKIDTTKSGSHVEANFGLKRGVWANGTIKAADTGEVFTGEISYYWFRDKSLEEAIPGLRQAYVDGLYWTDSQGRFRVPVLPTRGILAYRWDVSYKDQPPWAPTRNIDRFPRGLGAEAIDGKDKRKGCFPTMPIYLIAENYNCVAEVNPEPGQDSIDVPMILHASKPVRLEIVQDDLGLTPSTGYLVYGLNERRGWQRDRTAEDLIVEDLSPGESRKVFVFHRESGLAGGAVVDENVQQPVQIRLAKSGSVRGRLLDKNGDVIADGVLSVVYDKFRSEKQYAIWASHPDLRANPTKIPVDEEGRFELDGLIPGWKYSARVSAPRKRNGRMTSLGIGMGFTDLEIEPGESRDLGDLEVGYPAKEEKDKGESK